MKGGETQVGGEEDSDSESLLQTGDVFYYANAQRQYLSDEESRVTQEKSEEGKMEGEEEKSEEEEENSEEKSEGSEITDTTQENVEEPPCESTPKEGHGLRNRESLRQPEYFSVAASESQIEKVVAPI